MIPPPILNIPFRKSHPLELSTAVKQYISTKYDQHPDMFSADLVAIDRLRSDAIHVQEAHESGVQKLAEYAAQLQWMSGKFPIDIGADFTWQQALGNNTNKSVTQNNLQFERANVLYNLAALYSQLATACRDTSAEGLKQACNYYCASAGVLKYLIDSVIPELRSTPPEDMDVITLTCLEQLMLAQGQECFWLKAASGGFGDSIIAKLAASVSDFYDAAAEAGQKSGSIRSNGEWVHHMNAKHYHFAGAAQYRQACDCLEKSKYGEEVARLQDALDAAKEALSHQRYLNKIVVEDLEDLKAKVSNVLRDAEKDNDMIYLCPVPAPSSLPSINRAPMVKSNIPKEVKDGITLLSDTGPWSAPLFSKLVPFAVHVAASIYAERRDRLVNNTIGELESLTSRLHDLLQSLNLPGSLQALEKPLGLPPGIIAHAEEIRQQGGVEKLQQTVQDIIKLRSNDVLIFNEARDLLRAEAAEDELHRGRHGTDRWRREPSAKAAEKLLAQVTAHDGYLTSAGNSDQLVRDKLKEHEPLIRLLSGPLEELEDFVPNSSRAKLTPKMDREVGKLRMCINDVSRLESRRKRKVEALQQKARGDDIGTSILAEASHLERENPLRKVSTADFEPLFNTRLETHYSADKAQLVQEAEEQQELMERLREANNTFLASRKMDGSLKEREVAIQRLEIAHNKYNELIGNLEGGRKFYNDLAKYLGRFRDEVGHWVYQRRQEANVLEANINTNDFSNMRISTPVGAGTTEAQVSAQLPHMPHIPAAAMQPSPIHHIPVATMQPSQIQQHIPAAALMPSSPPQQIRQQHQPIPAAAMMPSGMAQQAIRPPPQQQQYQQQQPLSPIQQPAIRPPPRQPDFSQAQQQAQRPPATPQQQQPQQGPRPGVWDANTPIRFA
ncbi:Similar to pH-response regulator protein palA/RIM20; acc. no. P79020 [Pyronema omphalodes CBS 100304]|uniref:Similar to pH-response regulator protein palA/RIM20 acc. no. P79020 n=1 Tax=Pyronema omphalodes (strain CBS 100304) TaxID=1076935 RepID=U4LW29_PYROM|nr:Similar to pH-response regulator protein palA/RIM20; acc. no. P79020 [Pyronema omphalodes CBS 100304]